MGDCCDGLNVFLDRETKYAYRILRGRGVPTTVDIEMYANIRTERYCDITKYV